MDLGTRMGAYITFTFASLTLPLSLLLLHNPTRAPITSHLLPTNSHDPSVAHYPLAACVSQGVPGGLQCGEVRQDGQWNRPFPDGIRELHGREEWAAPKHDHQ